MKKERIHLYEGMFILSTTLSEDARKNALEKITAPITEKGGEIHKIHDIGKRRLAYEINKKREGVYYVIYFSLDSLKMNELWSEYHLHEDLIRFMTMQTDKVLEVLEYKPLVMN